MFDYKLLCKMYYAFQDTHSLYIIMDYFPGGDLRYTICEKDYFTEQETKFIGACIVLSLKYLHGKNVIHRDLKPENLCFDEKGYLHLIEFGISLECKKGETVTNASGTLGYMAPETIINKPHDFRVDYFALGVILYELMMGERPFQGKNRKEIRDNMFTIKINLVEDDVPSDWHDMNIINLINQLLKLKKKNRLGNNGIEEIMEHPWFKEVQWDQIENFEFKSPFKFDKEDNFYASFVNKIDDDSIYEGKEQIYINAINDTLLFNNFYYNFEGKNNEEKKKK